MNALGVPAVVAAVWLCSFSVAASQVMIEYELTGSMSFSIIGGFTTPVFGSTAPGPGGTGSAVTFAFDATPAGTPIGSGDVTIQSFRQSFGVTLPGYLSGFRALYLTGLPQFGPSGTVLPGPIVPITGGHLSGSTASGTLSGVGFRTGLLHCSFTGAACNAFFNLPTLAVSTPYPLGPNHGEPIPFGQWTFNSAFDGLSAMRFSSGYFSGTVLLVGTEIGRTVVPAPEPGVLSLLGPVLLVLVLGWMQRRMRGMLRGCAVKMKGGTSRGVLSGAPSVLALALAMAPATSFTAETSDLADLSLLLIVLDDRGNPVDLSALSRADQHRVVREFWTGTPAELRWKRVALATRQYEAGTISQAQYLAVADPEPDYCEYGPTNPPEGMTTERLHELLAETKGLAPELRYEIILDEAPVARESDDVVMYPVVFSIPAVGDPVCLQQ